MDQSDFGMFSFISFKKKAKIQIIFHILQYDNIHNTSILRTYVPAIKQKYLTKADPAPVRRACPPPSEKIYILFQYVHYYNFD